MYSQFDWYVYSRRNMYGSASILSLFHYTLSSIEKMLVHYIWQWFFGGFMYDVIDYAIGDSRLFILGKMYRK